VFSHRERKRAVWRWPSREEGGTRAVWPSREDVRAAPMSRLIPLWAKASRLVTPAEFREKNRLPAVYKETEGGKGGKVV